MKIGYAGLPWGAFWNDVGCVYGVRVCVVECSLFLASEYFCLICDACCCRCFLCVRCGFCCVDVVCSVVC